MATVPWNNVPSVAKGLINLAIKFYEITIYKFQCFYFLLIVILNYYLFQKINAYDPQLRCFTWDNGLALTTEQTCLGTGT